MNVDLWTKVNGNYEQQGNTSDMIFAVYEMLSYFSHHMRMVPGDILATGTPPGVGMGKNRFLAVGDVLECGISNWWMLSKKTETAELKSIAQCIEGFRRLKRSEQTA
jgi:2-keto-4-pentenoate hydratase/2-oxohepta-3-ene-1,7-dioic acid hydratase in catechol pathway